MKKRTGIGLLEGTRLLTVPTVLLGSQLVSWVHGMAGSLIRQRERNTLSDR